VLKTRRLTCSWLLRFAGTSGLEADERCRGASPGMEQEIHSERQPRLTGEPAWPAERDRQEQTVDVDSLLDAFVGVNAEGLITTWNLQAEDTFGWSRSEAMGRPVWPLIVPPRNSHRVEQSLRQLFLSDESSPPTIRTRTTALHRDGNEFEIEAIFFQMRSGGSNSIGLMARQLTQRRFTEEETEKRHHALMDQLGECYVESDLRGKITFVNKAYCNFYDVSREEREGGDYKTIFPPELVISFGKVYSQVYRTGETAKLDYSMTLHNGKQVFNEQSVSLRRDVQGNPVGFMVILRDCFERKQNEMELVKARHAAEAASKAKGEFLANMSHEIRTPLNGVIGMLELASDTNPTPQQREFLEMAQSAASSLLEVINDILDFSKVEAGMLELERTEFDLSETVAQAVGIMRITALKKELGLSFELASDVPRFLLGDPIRLKQVLLNLIGNAVKFTQHGQVKVRVQVEGIQHGKAELKFSVTDSGMGIPLEKQEVIFESFSQADASTTRKFGGTGLGLTICSRIVQVMGGNIWVESEMGKGSTFHFIVVLETTNSASLKPAESVVIDQAPAPSCELKILLAEDNLINQKLAVRLLEKLGHQVVLAETGVQALAKLKEQPFDLVLMDVQMPEMDGFTATAAIRVQEEGSNIRMPIVAMTAHAMKGDRERCLEAGMDDYVTKPISATAVRAAIERVLKSCERVSKQLH
jgi:PAS domain S-box-containing protein